MKAPVLTTRSEVGYRLRSQCPNDSIAKMLDVKRTIQDEYQALLMASTSVYEAYRETRDCNVDVPYYH